MQSLSQEKSGVEQVRRAGKELLRFNFSGMLTQKTAIDLCNEWRMFCKSQPGASFVIVFNAIQMENYEPMARVAFQKCLKEMKMHIDKIWVVTESKLVLGGAAIMSLIVGLPIRAVRTEEEIVI